MDGDWEIWMGAVATDMDWGGGGARFPTRGPLVGGHFDQNHQKLHDKCKNSTFLDIGVGVLYPLPTICKKVVYKKEKSPSHTLQGKRHYDNYQEVLKHIYIYAH